MGKKDKALVHLITKKSWWSGRITALCGVTAGAGTYQTSTWTLFGLPGPKCPACEAIYRAGAT